MFDQGHVISHAKSSKLESHSRVSAFLETLHIAPVIVETLRQNINIKPEECVCIKSSWKHPLGEESSGKVIT